ncbi:MAG: pilus assembly protein [Firmicutes bacterium]|nr:pilus assembly protein [Bacillota bacterium]
MWERLGRDEKGQSLVEFALVVPILLLLVLGIMEFGRAYSANLTLQNATREGARLAVTGATDAQITQHVKDSAPTLDVSRLNVSVTPSTRRQGDNVMVTVTYDFNYLTPLIQNLVGSLRTFTQQVTMRME